MKIEDVKLDTWSDIVNHARDLEARIDSLADKLSTAQDAEEFYFITNSMFRMLSVANKQTGDALVIANQLHKNVSLLMMTTETMGNA